MNYRLTFNILVGMGAFLCGTCPASTQDFYHGKTINIVVGFSPGGNYDLIARVLSKHFGNHIPGKPLVIVQNMTGAGGSTAVLYLYGRAARDGTIIGMPPRSYATAPLANDQLRYDARQLIALGSTTNEVQVGVVWHEVGVTKIDDLKTREISVGLTSFHSDIGTHAVMAKVITGAKLKMVSGYPGGNEIAMAMERREVDAQFGMSLGVLKTRMKSWIEQKKVNVIFQSGLEKSPEMPNVPFIMDYAKNDIDRKALELLLASNAFAWPFVTPPGVPGDRVSILRRAFDAAMKDPDFLNDAKQSGLEINPMSGEAMQAITLEQLRVLRAELGEVRTDTRDIKAQMAVIRAYIADQHTEQNLLNSRLANLMITFPMVSYVYQRKR